MTGMDIVLLSLAALGASIVLTQQRQRPPAKWISRALWLVARVLGKDETGAPHADYFVSCATCVSVWIGSAVAAVAFTATGDWLAWTIAFLPVTAQYIVSSLSPQRL